MSNLKQSNSMITKKQVEERIDIINVRHNDNLYLQNHKGYKNIVRQNGNNFGTVLLSGGTLRDCFNYLNGYADSLTKHSPK